MKLLRWLINIRQSKPKSLKFYLKFLGISENDLLKYIDPMRDKSIWKKIGNYKYVKKFHIKK